jgi:hypothetical protein
MSPFKRFWTFTRFKWFIRFKVHYVLMNPEPLNLNS